MKRTELLKIITKEGAVLVRHGSKHDWYTNYELNVSQPVPRHKEIKNPVARSIIKTMTKK